MKRLNQLNIKRGLLSKLVLLVALFLGSSNAWAQKALPYSYGFENNNLGTEGWQLLNPNTGSYNTGIAYSGYTSHSGSYYFRFYSNDNPPQTLISPLLQDSDGEIVVSLYYRVAAKNFNQTFQVGYTSETVDPANNMTWKDAVTGSITTYEQCEYTLPAHTRYIAIKCTTTTPSESISNNYYLCIDDFQVELNNPYKVPTDFVLSSYTGNSATFSWTAGSDESSWKFAYSTDADFTPNTGTAASITANPYTLTGLTEGTTYYACICADYGGGNYSDWTEKVAFTPIYKMPTNFSHIRKVNSTIIKPVSELYRKLVMCLYRQYRHNDAHTLELCEREPHLIHHIHPCFLKPAYIIGMVNDVHSVCLVIERISCINHCHSAAPLFDPYY